MSALAFGPSVSRALGVEVGASGAMHAHCMEMASPAGMAASMSVAQGGAQPDGPAPHRPAPNLLDCCALCAIAATPMAILSFDMPPWQAVEVTAFVPAGAPRARPHQRATWPSAAPRGPPSPA